MRVIFQHVSELLGALGRTVDGVEHAFTAGLLLFVFGSVLLALAETRMDKLELEVAARPARSFALGLVGLVGLVAVAVALSVTVIGLPFAACGALVAVFAAYAGIVAVLRTIGALLLRHRTDNRYLHLALGCALFVPASAIPWLGDWIAFGVGMLGLGAVFGSRLAGFWHPRASRCATAA